MTTDLEERVRQECGWKDLFDSTLFLVLHTRAERDAYRRVLELLAAKLTWDPASPGAKAVLEIRETALEALRDWP